MQYLYSVDKWLHTKQGLQKGHITRTFPALKFAEAMPICRLYWLRKDKMEIKLASDNQKVHRTTKLITSMHLIIINLILCHKPFPWLNSLEFLNKLMHYCVVRKEEILTYCTCIVLESKTVRTGASTWDGGSCAVNKVTWELFVQPASVQAVSRNWCGVKTAKSRARKEQEFTWCIHFNLFSYSFQTLVSLENQEKRGPVCLKSFEFAPEE